MRLTAKFGPLAKRHSWAFVSGLLDTFLTHLASVVSGRLLWSQYGVLLLLLLLELKLKGKQDVLRFKLPLYWLSMHQFSLLIIPFGHPSVVLCHSLSKLFLVFQECMMSSFPHPINKGMHSQENLQFKTLVNCLMHVSHCRSLKSMMLLMFPTCSFSNCHSASLII